ncbi:uncharacterized protein LOC123518302 [Portunus trituberculatus]|uniref:uncharacterized protein LOC123518302 n=1 Tax=Portunus trituberculatus TaxID=210409 RepID=UPI001E1D12C0|nr:uncharacterized protein LOC123518302 [Portunus trituberculatus]
MMMPGCGRLLVGREILRRQSNEKTCPSVEFKSHFERVLNPQPAPPPLHVSTHVTIPVLDDPITTTEVECQIKKMKVDKACGPDGISPGVLTMLPAQWLHTITSLFNAVFASEAWKQHFGTSMTSLHCVPRTATAWLWQHSTASTNLGCL